MYYEESRLTLREKLGTYLLSFAKEWISSFQSGNFLIGFFRSLKKSSTLKTIKGYLYFFFVHLLILMKTRHFLVLPVYL